MVNRAQKWQIPFSLRIQRRNEPRQIWSSTVAAKGNIWGANRKEMIIIRGRSTLAHSSVLKWRHHELTPALQTEKITREGQKKRIHRFLSYSYPAPIISCLQPPIYPTFFPPSPVHTRSFFFLINKKRFGLFVSGIGKTGRW